MNLIQLENVSKVYKENKREFSALSKISLDIEKGSFTALSGPSGSGKTTLLNLIMCLIRPTTGKVFFDGQEIEHFTQRQMVDFRQHKIGYIFQDFNLIPTFSVIENIEYILWLQKVSAVERRKRALAICHRFGIQKLTHRRPSQLSRGEQQRVAVARAVVHKPKMILGDEMTANLDHKAGQNLMNFLKELREQEKITLLYATHDPVMLKAAERIICLEDGQLINDIRLV